MDEADVRRADGDGQRIAKRLRHAILGDGLAVPDATTAIL